MDNFEYRFDFMEDRGLRPAFNQILIDIHGLDLTLWDERVGWDRDFVPFAFFSGDTIVAVTCIYALDLIVRGEWRRVAQVSSVGTRPEYRKQGLNAELTRRALAWSRKQKLRGTFLFSDDDAIGFYAKQGFVERAEWKHRVTVDSAPRPEYQVLDFDRDEDLIVRLVESRTPVSNTLGARSPKLELFHLVYENAGELRYVEELDLIVCCDEGHEVLTVYDLIGPELPAWSAIEPRVLGAGTTSVVFEITPDRLGLSDAEPIEHRANRLHVFEHEDLIEGKVIFPFTAHA